MSDDGKKNPRDNVSPKLKPKDAKNENVAPAGHMGIANNSPSLNLGSGVKVVNVSYQMVVQENEQSPEQTELKAEVEDTRPIAVATGDKDIDAQSEADGFQLKTQDEINELSGVDQQGEPLEPDQPPNSFDEMMQDDGSTRFAKSNDQDVNKLYEQRGETPVSSFKEMEGRERENTSDDAINPEDESSILKGPQGSMEDLKSAFKRARFRTNSLHKSQQIEPD